MEELSATMSEPEPEAERTVPTIAPEEEPHRESEQGSEPTTPAAEVTETNYWLKDFKLDMTALKTVWSMICKFIWNPHSLRTVMGTV